MTQISDFKKGQRVTLSQSGRMQQRFERLAGRPGTVTATPRSTSNLVSVRWDGSRSARSYAPVYLEIMPSAPDGPLYYIQNGVDDYGCAWWWKPERAGYTSDLNAAGVYTHAEAIGIIRNRRPDERAWPVEYVQRAHAAQQLKVFASGLERAQALKDGAA